MKCNLVKQYFLCFLLAFSFSGCDDNYYSSIPDVPVYIKLNLTAAHTAFKNSSNQFLLFEKNGVYNDLIGGLGYGGVLVYSGLSLDDSGNTVYYAFDMSCPYEADKDIKVYPKEDGFGEVVCEKCGSIYNLGYGFGNPTSGPSTESLKRYKAKTSGYDYLIITR